MRFHISQDAAGEWRWRLRADNSRIIADSGEGYKTRAGVIAAAWRLVKEMDAEGALRAAVTAAIERLEEKK
jgi:uncharacterized protein YegP (UPF0339 family)